jgi:hypothetical protein
MSHTHWPGNKLPNGKPASKCPFPTLKVCNEWYGTQSDNRYIDLALTADLKWHRDKSPDAVMYSQVVQVLKGVRPDITNKEGNPNMSVLAIRLRAAIKRRQEGV